MTESDLNLLPCALYTAAEVRELDRIAIEERGIAGIKLMKRAGRAAFELLGQRWPHCTGVSVFTGGGNNGGDGYVLAALAAQRLLPVRVVELAAAEKLTPDARAARDYALQEGVEMLGLSEWQAESGEVIVDALLGTGLQGAVRGDYRVAIDAINQAGLPVLALDIPSGLCADSGAIAGGEAEGAAVFAEATITFIGLKRGLFTGRAKALCGEISYSDLDVPEDIFERVEAELRRVDLPQLLFDLPARELDAHKGDLGHVMIIGGDSGYGGAVIMAAEAAARAGAGLVSAATRPEHIAPLLARRPEVMACGVNSGQALEPLLDKPTLLVVGPGLGQSPWSEQMLQQALDSELPLVLDADALNLLAQGRILGEARRDNWILTPHPGEAARLLGTTTAAVQADRIAAVKALQQRYGGVAVLKGAGTLIASADGMALVAEGNAGMATGGMGDVLSGLIGGLWAQGDSGVYVAQLATALHSAAADLAVAGTGTRSLLATDLLPFIGAQLSEYGH